MPRYTRRVHFFHVTIHTKDGNVFQEYYPEQTEDDFSAACRKIQAMHVSEKTSKLIDSSQSYRLIYFEKVGDHYEGKVAKYRANHMLAGNISDDKLVDLSAGDGREFVEVTHFIYSPKKHVLSFEYSQTGPRVSAFTQYINKLRGKDEIDINLFVPELIPHPSVIERLKDVKRVKQLTVGISADRIPSSTTSGNLLRGMSFIRGFTNAGMISVNFSAGTALKGEGIIDPAQLIRTLENEVDFDILGKVSIEALTDYGDETINLIDNKMVGTKEWQTPITTENFKRWFSDITDMYTQRTGLIDQALRKNAKDTR